MSDTRPPGSIRARIEAAPYAHYLLWLAKRVATTLAAVAEALGWL